MQVVYEKIAILEEYLVLASITAGSSRVINMWTRTIGRLIARERQQQRPRCHASVDLVCDKCC